MRADRKELNSKEAKEFFKRYGIDLKLTMAYNPAADGKVEWGHVPIVSSLVKVCGSKKGNGQFFCHLPCWPTKQLLALL